MTRVIVLAVLSIAIAAARIGGVKHKSYQAVAHIFVGGLAGAWLVTHDRFLAGLFWSLCAVEIVCFLVGRLRKRTPHAIP